MSVSRYLWLTVYTLLIIIEPGHQDETEEKKEPAVASPADAQTAQPSHDPATASQNEPQKTLVTEEHQQQHEATTVAAENSNGEANSKHTTSSAAADSGHLTTAGVVETEQKSDNPDPAKKEAAGATETTATTLNGSGHVTTAGAIENQSTRNFTAVETTATAGAAVQQQDGTSASPAAGQTTAVITHAGAENAMLSTSALDRSETANQNAATRTSEDHVTTPAIALKSTTIGKETTVEHATEAKPDEHAATTESARHTTSAAPAETGQLTESNSNHMPGNLTNQNAATTAAVELSTSPSPQSLSNALTTGEPMATGGHRTELHTAPPVEAVQATTAASEHVETVPAGQTSTTAPPQHTADDNRVNSTTTTAAPPPSESEDSRKRIASAAESGSITAHQSENVNTPEMSTDGEHASETKTTTASTRTATTSTAITTTTTERPGDRITTAELDSHHETTPFVEVAETTTTTTSSSTSTTRKEENSETTSATPKLEEIKTTEHSSNTTTPMQVVERDTTAQGYASNKTVLEHTTAENAAEQTIATTKSTLPLTNAATGKPSVPSIADNTCTEDAGLCPLWRKNGFCTHPSYKDQSVRLCPLSCGTGCEIRFGAEPVKPVPGPVPVTQQPAPQYCPDVSASYCTIWVRFNWCSSHKRAADICGTSCKIIAGSNCKRNPEVRSKILHAQNDHPPAEPPPPSTRAPNWIAPPNPTRDFCTQVRDSGLCNLKSYCDQCQKSCSGNGVCK